MNPRASTQEGAGGRSSRERRPAERIRLPGSASSVAHSKGEIMAGWNLRMRLYNQLCEYMIVLQYFAFLVQYLRNPKVSSRFDLFFMIITGFFVQTGVQKNSLDSSQYKYRHTFLACVLMLDCRSENRCKA
jgi:hypothetical protein